MSKNAGCAGNKITELPWHVSVLLTVDSYRFVQIFTHTNSGTELLNSLFILINQSFIQYGKLE